MPPQHRAALRGDGVQPEAVPGDGVWQRRRPVHQTYLQGQAGRRGLQEDLRSGRICGQVHCESHCKVTGEQGIRYVFLMWMRK